jgi:RNA polymerase sigma-70 factor (ECF subfamily)
MAETPLPSNTEGPGGRLAGLPVDWAVTLAEHDRWLRTAVFARLGERQAVDEVMQEVALAALAQQAPLREPSRVGPWLYRLAVRLVLLYRRRRGRQRRLLDQYAQSRGHQCELSSTPDPLAYLIRDERGELIRTTLATLPRRDAEILLLKYTEDWSYRELAAHLGVSQNAVEARLYRARKRLREAIANTGTSEVLE